MIDDAKSISIRMHPDLERGSTWSEEYRMKCEAIMLLRCAKERRLEYYQNIKRRRGEEAFRQLNAMVRWCYQEQSENREAAA